ncbi:4854_t:CDS:2, partial [Diversispora eburnea]
MITQRWYKDIYQDETNLQESIILNYERDTHNNEFINKSILPIRCFFIILTTVPMLRKAVLEQEDDEITAFLQDYIRKKLNQNMSAEISAINK